MLHKPAQSQLGIARPDQVLIKGSQYMRVTDAIAIISLGSYAGVPRVRHQVLGEEPGDEGDVLIGCSPRGSDQVPLP